VLRSGCRLFGQGERESNPWRAPASARPPSALRACESCVCVCVSRNTFDDSDAARRGVVYGAVSSCRIVASESANACSRCGGAPASATSAPSAWSCSSSGRCTTRAVGRGEQALHFALACKFAGCRRSPRHIRTSTIRRADTWDERARHSPPRCMQSSNRRRERRLDSWRCRHHAGAGVGGPLVSSSAAVATGGAALNHEIGRRQGLRAPRRFLVEARTSESLGGVPWSAKKTARTSGAHPAPRHHHHGGLACPHRRARDAVAVLAR
jgi:hypothetical protein